MIEIAEKLISMGFYIFPLVANRKIPDTESWQALATRDLDKAKDFFIDPVFGGLNNRNIGISTQRIASGEALIVVDVDDKNGKEGSKNLEGLQLIYGALPKTVIQTTPTGGRHIIFKSSKTVANGTDVLAEGLDIRSSGGLIVGAGSSINGVYYTMKGTEIADCPQWIVEQCNRPREKKIDETATEALEEERVRARYWLENNAPIAVEYSGGNDTTFRVACKLKDFGLEQPEAEFEMLNFWNERCEPPWEPVEISQIIENAFRHSRDRQGNDSPQRMFTSLPTVEDETPTVKFSLEPGSLNTVDVPEDFFTSKAHSITKVEEKPQATFNLMPEDETDTEEINLVADSKEDAIENLNKNFAFVISGGGHHILWETEDADGNFEVQHLMEATFHKKFASRKLQVSEDKSVPLTQLWMVSAKRRDFDGICFKPGLDPKGNYYNLWRGFKFEPADTASHPALDLFLEHALENVCGNDEKLYIWLMTFFAHMIQKPWKKPLAAIVFKGRKGVGKNALIENVGALLGNHYLLSSKRRHLIGDFNSHMQNLLMLTLDEAFWSGDRQAEGVLKDLVTGKYHNIEHKGKEIFKVDNCTRIAILGNEDWLVPASEDERRYAVFEVGEARRQDLDFFEAMYRGFEDEGGYAHLLRYLMDWDLTQANVNLAPQTEALLEQKLNSLEPVQQWWLDSLYEGHIIGAFFNEEDSWDEDVIITKDQIMGAFRSYSKERRITTRVSSFRDFTKVMKRVAPGIMTLKNGVGFKFSIPPLNSCRGQWDKFIGHKVDWIQVDNIFGEMSP